MQLEQFEKCMSELGIFNGSSCRAYHDAQEKKHVSSCVCVCVCVRARMFVFVCVRDCLGVSL